MIASVAFRNFKALRNTGVALLPFNLVIGPNGSGKTSLIESLLRLGALARRPLREPAAFADTEEGMPQVQFGFDPPHADVAVRISCTSEESCDQLQLETSSPAGWQSLRPKLAGIRGHVFDHVAIGAAAPRPDGAALSTNGSNLAAVLYRLREEQPAHYTELTAQLLRLMPEFRAFELVRHPDDRVEFALRLGEGGLVPAHELSQGMLYLVAVLTLAYDPAPPALLCIEEVDRGIHPRLLRDVRDALYRLSYPEAAGLDRPAVQVIATTHSPYLIDQFREHPEEVVISQKHGRAARFERLSDRPDLPGLLQEGTLGDMWYSGILGGVPE